jgi:hypothetical protein
MRIWRHASDDDDGTKDAPVWTAGKPVWAEVRIQAPTAAHLAHHEDVPAPHRAA